ncbi:hypothetical protein ACB092_11G263000 [Castanea dentata]
MVYEIFENMLSLKKLQTFIFPLIRYFKLPSWILHIPSYRQSHPKAIIVDLHFHVQTNLIFHSDFHYHKSSTNLMFLQKVIFKRKLQKIIQFIDYYRINMIIYSSSHVSQKNTQFTK